MEIDKIDLDAVYGVSECLDCKGHGHVLICVDDKLVLYLECDECGAQWDNPKAILSKIPSTREKYKFHHYAWYEEVEEEGWLANINIIRGGLYYDKVYPMFRYKNKK